MILGIGSPVEERAGRRVGSALAHVAGGLVGGVAAGVTAWLVLTPIRTMVPPGSALVLVACVAALLALALDLRLIGDARAQGSQVPATWRHRWGDTTAFGAYGAVLGAGWASYVPYALTYVAFVASGIFLPFGWAVVGGAAFGLSRALVVAGGAIFPELASHLLFRARHAARVTSTLSGIACLAVAGGLLANVFSS